MAREIERKFLVRNGARFNPHATEDITQGYVTPDSEVRIHIDTDTLSGRRTAFLTLKTKKNGDNIEWKSPFIAIEEAKEMQDAWHKTVTKKTQCDMSQPGWHDILQADVPVDKSTIRVRISTDRKTKQPRAFITLKTKTDTTQGVIDRGEWEYEIAPQQAQKMLAISCENTFQKVRHHLQFEGKKWTIDEFIDRCGDMLRVAEIELTPEEIGKDIPLLPCISKEDELTINRDFSSRKLAALVVNPKKGFSDLLSSIRKK